MNKDNLLKRRIELESELEDINKEIEKICGGIVVYKDGNIINSLTGELVPMNVMTRKELTQMLEDSERNSQKLMEIVVAYTIRTRSMAAFDNFRSRDKKISKYSNKEKANSYTKSGAIYAGIMWSFLNNKYNINSDSPLLEEIAKKAFIAMGFRKDTKTNSKLSYRAAFNYEVCTRHLISESVLGKKRNNKYCKDDIDRWGLIKGDYLIQSVYKTKETKNSNPERYIDIPSLYGDRSGSLDDSIERISYVVFNEEVE